MCHFPASIDVIHGIRDAATRQIKHGSQVRSARLVCACVCLFGGNRVPQNVFLGPAENGWTECSGNALWESGTGGKTIQPGILRA